MNKSKKILLQIPIYILLAYLCLTLILYAFGPFAWENPQPVAFWLLQVAYLGALFAGWQLALRFGKKNETEEVEEEFKWQDIILKWLPRLLIVFAVVAIINLFRRFGFSNFNFIKLVKRIAWGIKNPGESYADYQYILSVVDSSQILGGKVMTVVNYLWGLVEYVVLLLAMYYFKRINLLGKCFLAVDILLVVVDYLSIGTNIGIFRLVLAALVFFVLWGIKVFLRADRKQKIKFLWICGAVVVLAAIFIIILFDVMMKSRGGILNWDSPEYNVGGYGLNRNSFVFAILPESLYMTAISGSAYLTQGYQGMALALSVDWKPTFGLGHNMWLMKTLRSIGLDIMPRTYQVRIMEVANWDSEIRWHSMYTWWANDVGFIGTIFVMFAIGFLFALAYRDCFETKNPFARLMVFFFALMAFFIPCNNQLFQSAPIFLSFCTTLILWLITRGTLPALARWIYRKCKRKE